MAGSLLSNANNAYYKSAAVLMGSPQRVKVLVEDEFDIPFWNDILRCHAPEKHFSITPYAYENGNYSLSSLTKGKEGVIAKMKDFGPNFIGCIDSDYDYILRHHDARAAELHSHDFIIPTYSYAVENLLCDPKTLKDLCITAACCTDINFDFEGFFKDISVIVYPLVVWSAFLKYLDKTECFSPKNWSKILDKSLTLANSDKHDILSNIKDRVEAAITDLNTEYKAILSDKIEFEETISKTGDLSKELAWTFVRGHDFADFILHCLLKPLVNMKRKRHISYILKCTKDPLEKKNVLNHYNNLSKDPKILLGINFAWHRSHPHSEMIISRITDIFEINK